MLTNFLCNKKGTEIIKDSELKKFINKKGSKLWIKISNISKEEEKFLGDVFEIHPTTIEDIESIQTRVKYEEFEEYTLIIFKGIKEVKENFIEDYNFSLIIGKNYVISVDRGDSEIIEELSKNTKS